MLGIKVIRRVGEMCLSRFNISIFIIFIISKNPNNYIYLNLTKKGGDGENGRCLTSKMSGEGSVKDRSFLRKLGRVMGIVQSKQVAVDFGWELEKIGKLIVKIIEAGKEVAQSAGMTPKSQENKGIF